MKTRSKPTVAANKEVVDHVQPKSLPAPDPHPHKAFILPDTLSSAAKIFTHLHPRTQKPTRYYHCPESGFYEIKTFSSSPIHKKSLLLAPQRPADSDEGYVLQTATFHAVTPLDPMFLFLPLLAPETKDGKDKKPMFLTVEDYLDSMGSSGAQLRRLCVEHPTTLRLVERRLGKICDVVSAGEDTMYRLNQEKLLKHLVARASVMVKAGLPPSMEEHFVKKVLEVPMAYLLQEEAKKPALLRAETTETDASFISQDSPGIITPATSFTESIPGPTIIPPSSSSSPQTSGPETSTAPSYIATESIVHLLRLRVAFSFLLSSYISHHLSETLQSHLSPPNSPLDFTPLTTHLSALTTLKNKISAQARDLMNGDSRKRLLEDEEANADREEKKRKLAEEERKRKASESRAVRDLKKVNTKGMKKMSDFFGRKKE